MNENSISFESEKLQELKSTLLLITNWMVLPLYFLFWIADIIYYPDYMWKFLFLRLWTLPACLIVRTLVEKIHRYRQGEWLAFFFIFSLASIINAMIYIIGDFSTSYYAGLNLVAIGSLTFIPWSVPFFFLTGVSIFAPYIIGAAAKVPIHNNAPSVLVNLFFVVGTIVIAFVIRSFHQYLRIKEFKSRHDLREEVENRGLIIKEKTKEALRLSRLSSQFSPQIVDAIKNNQIDIDRGISRSKICVLFADIVNSTERVANLDKDKVHEVISTFMDDTIKILLKYDITIDKFLGDGVLAFSNAPLLHADYMERVVNAALEIREQTKFRESFYQQHWQGPLQMRIGIAVGYANVGFYGDDRYFKSYTAIGPVINLANRLCGACQPGQIIISADAAMSLNHHHNYTLQPLPKLTLKGFESSTVEAFEVQIKNGTTIDNVGETDCPACQNGLMVLDTDQKGIYIFKCRSCGHVKDDRQKISLAQKAS